MKVNGLVSIGQTYRKSLNFETSSRLELHIHPPLYLPAIHVLATFIATDASMEWFRLRMSWLPATTSPFPLAIAPQPENCRRNFRDR